MLPLRWELFVTHRDLFTHGERCVQEPKFRPSFCLVCQNTKIPKYQNVFENTNRTRAQICALVLVAHIGEGTGDKGTNVAKVIKVPKVLDNRTSGQFGV